MKLSKLRYFILFIAILMLVTNTVNAQRLSEIFDPIAELIRDYATDDNFSLVVDLILYIWFFAQFVPSRLKSKYGDQARRVGMPIGVILAVSLTILELRTGFRVSHFAPVALLIIVLNIMELFQTEEGLMQEIFRPLRLGLIFILLHMLIVMLAQAPIVGGFIANTFLMAIGNLLRLLGILIIIFGVGAGTARALRGLGGDDTTPRGGVTPVATPPAPAPRDEREVNVLTGQINNLITEINNFENVHQQGFHHLVTTTVTWPAHAGVGANTGAFPQHGVPPNQRRAILTRAAAVLEEATNIRGAIANIQTSGQFFNLRAADRRNFVNAVIGFIQQYTNFIQDYNSAIIYMW